MPKIIPFATTSKPGEIKILYVDNNFKRKGLGTQLIVFLENNARKKGYTELLVRSANRYVDTGYAFYSARGYKAVGKVTGGEGSEKMRVFVKLI